MAPALTSEPLSPKEKLPSTASPATRQSIRKLETPTTSSDCVSVSVSSNSPITAKKPASPQVLSTRVTRSKDAPRRRSSIVQSSNKRKPINNNNNNNTGVKHSDEQMGLSAATTHTNTDSSANSSGCSAIAANNNNNTSGGAATVAVAVASAAEHNNNRKDNSTAQLLADLTNDFEEAITAEICLRKTLPEVNLSKEPPNGATNTPDLLLAVTPSHMDAQSTSAAAAAVGQEVTPLENTIASPQQPEVVNVTACNDVVPTTTVKNSLSCINTESTAVTESIAITEPEEIIDNLEERLSQLDGSALPPIVDITAATLEAAVALPPPPLPTTPERHEDEQQQQTITVPVNTPQHLRSSTSALTPQSNASSSINFLKDGAAGAVLEDQEIEEVLKALKTLDGAHVNPDTICDFNFFNEVCFLNNEDEAAGVGVGPSGSNVQPHVAGSLDAEPKSSSIITGESQVNKLRPWEESHAELEQQQHVITRKIDFLLRRMRKFQARTMCCHTSDEVAGIFEWAARSSNKAPTPVRSAKLSEQEATVMSIVSGRPSSSFWEEQKKQLLPVPQMSTVLRHIKTVARQQQVSHTIGSGSASLAPSSTWYSSSAVPGKRPRKQLPDNAANSLAGSVQQSVDAATPRSDEIVPIFDTHVTNELTHIAGLLHTEMREVQNAIDSDATESSSGGESADEMVTYNNSQQLSLPITRRAVWRYSRDRAAIALRWSWLCAQIGDLEIKIRQHSDLYTDLSRTKGEVVLETVSSTKNTPMTLAANGYKSASAQDDAAADDLLCSRTRPLVLSEFRKRKLFQTTNMHTISKKAARPSNIKCGCQWPQIPCTLCTGRSDPTAPRDLPETMMLQNRVALLDPGYHPVLSFADDVSQSVHLEAISRQPDWQYRVTRCQAKAIVKSVWKAEREALAASGVGAGRRPGETGKRRYVRRKERNNAVAAVNNGSSNPSGGPADSGNGTGTATTSTSTTPTTTPLVANTALAKKQRQTALLIGSSSSTLLSPDCRPHRLPTSHNHSHSSSLISSGNGAKKQRKPATNTAAAAATTNLTSSKSNYSIHQHPHLAHSSKQISNKSHTYSKLNGDNTRLAHNSSDQWETAQRSRNSSPSHGGSNGNGSRSERSTERRSRTVYDIDNIVIPYSIAAATRVEILPYKEIPTPKWRIIDSDIEKQLQPQNPERTDHLLSSIGTPNAELTNGCTIGSASEKPQTIEFNKAKASSSPPKTKKTESTTNKSYAKTAELAANLPSEDVSQTTKKQANKVNGIRHTEERNLEKLELQEVTKLSSAETTNLEQQNNLDTATVVNGKAKSKKNKKKKAKKSKSKSKKSADGTVPREKDILASTANNVTTIKENALSANSIQAKATIEARNSAKAKRKKPRAKRLRLELQKPPMTASESAKHLPTDVPTAEHEVEDETEDISDEAFIVRHQRALIEEQRRFETFLKFPWTGRPRANRRVDSRAESSGANTPDPASPAAQLTSSSMASVGADSESIPSPLAQSVYQNPLDAHNESISSLEPGSGSKASTGRQERRRTTSSKLREHERRSITPEPLEPPLFEPLQFPLKEEIYQQMLAEQYAEPKSVRAKRAKSKSVSSNCDGSSTAGGSRRSSKAKITGSTCGKLALPHINGDDAYTVQKAHDDNDAMDYEPLAPDELMLDEEDDDYPKHHLAPHDDDRLPNNDPGELYDACIDAYAGDHALDEELDEVDDPFMDDDPNDPEWKRGFGIRHERMRKRI